MTLDHALTSSYRDATVQDVLQAPLTALNGVSAESAEALQLAFKIDTVQSLGKNILFRFAQAMAVMGSVKNDAVHSDWGGRPLRDVLDEPPTIVKYISEDQAGALKSALGINTIKEMGTAPAFLAAQAFVNLGVTLK